MLFADATGLPVKATFTDGGQPISFSLFEEPVLEVKFFVKNVSSSISRSGLRDFSSFLSIKFVYEPILIKISMNTIMNTNKGRSRSHIR